MRARGRQNSGRIALSSRASWRSTALLVAVILPFAIGTHFVGELGALGFERDVPVALGAHHLYLAMLLIASLLTTFSIVRDERRRSGSRALKNLIDALPWRGEGLGFLGLCLAIQAVFFCVTQSVEGSPLEAGDVAFGSAVAAATALLSSLFISYLKREILALALHFCRTWYVARRARIVRFSRVTRPLRTARRRWAVLASRANRPPPTLLSVA